MNRDLFDFCDWCRDEMRVKTLYTPSLRDFFTNIPKGKIQS